MLSLKRIHRLPHDTQAVYDLMDNTGKVHETKLMTQSEANSLNKTILWSDRHRLGRDMTGLWVTEGQFDRVVFEFELSAKIKKEIGKNWKPIK